MAAQEDDDNEDEGVSDGDLTLLLPVHGPGVFVPLVDDAADAKVEEGEGGEGNETEEDGGENHGEGGVERVHSQSCWSDEVFGDHPRKHTVFFVKVLITFQYFQGFCFRHLEGNKNQTKHL